jgi:hypothetical protein
VFKTALGAVEELVNEHNVTGPVFFLQGTHGTDADKPGDAEFFHRPEIGAMIEFAGKDAVAAAMSGQKNDLASGQSAGEQIVRGRSKRGLDFDPFLAGESIKMVKAGAADDADARFRHAQIFNRETCERHEKNSGNVMGRARHFVRAGVGLRGAEYCPPGQWLQIIFPGWRFEFGVVVLVQPDGNISTHPKNRD